jgi:hypothetical protein
LSAVASDCQIQTQQCVASLVVPPSLALTGLAVVSNDSSELCVCGDYTTVMYYRSPDRLMTGKLSYTNATMREVCHPIYRPSCSLGIVYDSFLLGFGFCVLFLACVVYYYNSSSSSSSSALRQFCFLSRVQSKKPIHALFPLWARRSLCVVYNDGSVALLGLPDLHVLMEVAPDRYARCLDLRCFHSPFFVSFILTLILMSLCFLYFMLNKVLPAHSPGAMTV